MLTLLDDADNIDHELLAQWPMLAMDMVAEPQAEEAAAALIALTEQTGDRSEMPAVEEAPAVNSVGVGDVAKAADVLPDGQTDDGDVVSAETFSAEDEAVAAEPELAFVSVDDDTWQQDELLDEAFIDRTDVIGAESEPAFATDDDSADAGELLDEAFVGQGNAVEAEVEPALLTVDDAGDNASDDIADQTEPDEAGSEAEPASLFVAPEDDPEPLPESVPQTELDDQAFDAEGGSVETALSGLIDVLNDLNDAADEQAVAAATQAYSDQLLEIAMAAVAGGFDELQDHCLLLQQNLAEQPPQWASTNTGRELLETWPMLAMDYHAAPNDPQVAAALAEHAAHPAWGQTMCNPTTKIPATGIASWRRSSPTRRRSTRCRPKPGLPSGHRSTKSSSSCCSWS